MTIYATDVEQVFTNRKNFYGGEIMESIIRYLRKSIILVLTITLLIVLTTSTVLAQEGSQTLDTNKENIQILVKYGDAYDLDSIRSSILSSLSLSKFELKKNIKIFNLAVYEISEDDDINKVITSLKENLGVTYAQPNYRLTKATVPDDARFDEQWSLLNNGQAIQGKAGTSGIDSNITDAWNITTGNDDVIIGILDSGIDISHTELTGSIYNNHDEIPNNGIDDDNNGYKDDVNGWDFINDDNTVFDSAISDTHGTQLAGIIAAADNETGIMGIAPSVKILPLKFLDGDYGYTSDAIEAIYYARKAGARIINCSWGSNQDNFALKEAMNENNILFICSAGNSGSQSLYYPACFDFPNIISVAAIDNTGELADLSNYGNNTLLAAPGVDILTTVPDNGYGYKSGTSLSTAHVSGAAALLQSTKPSIKVSEIIATLGKNTTKLDSLDGKVLSGGVLNVHSALTNIIINKNELENQKVIESEVSFFSASSINADDSSNGLPLLEEQMQFGTKGINVATGNYCNTFTDLSNPTSGLAIEASRTYNSKNTEAGILGSGWTFGYEGKVTDYVDYVKVKYGNGKIEVFTKNTDATYTGYNTRNKLEKLSDGSYIIEMKSQNSYKFNSLGYLTEIKDKNGNKIEIVVNDLGEISSVKDISGRIYTLSYQTYETQRLLKTFSDDLGYRTINYDYALNSGTGQYTLSTVTDFHNNIVMRYYYDANGLLNEIGDNDENNIMQTIQYYSDVTRRVQTSKDALGNICTYTYYDTPDANNKRKVTVVDTQQKAESYWYDNEYYITDIQDAEGKVTSTIYNTDEDGRNRYGEEDTKIDRYGNKTIYVRDDRGNITRIINPDLSIKSFVYDERNNMIEECDELGRHTYNIFDSNKINLLKKVQPLNGTDIYSGEDRTSPKFAITTYEYYSDTTYSVKGLLAKLIDPEGNTTEYTYLNDGKLNTVKQPDALNATIYSYTVAGFKETEISPEGARIDYTYDNNGRIEKKVINNLIDATENSVSRIVYDAMGRKIKEIMPEQYKPNLDDIANHVYDVENTDKDNYYNYAYYPNGKLKAVTDPEGYTTTYDSYDKYGNVTTEIKPNGAVYEYEYDLLNRLIKVYFKNSINEPDTTRVLLEEYCYEKSGETRNIKIHIKYLNDTEKAITEFVYDYAGRLIIQKNSDGSELETNLKPNGNINYTSSPSGKEYYRYDGLNRLIHTWTPIEDNNGETVYSYEGFVYDKSGNIKVKKNSKEKVALFVEPEAGNIISTFYEYYGTKKLKTVSDNSLNKLEEYHYNEDGNVDIEYIYSDTNKYTKTEYYYNHLSKVKEKLQYVMGGDIYGNSFFNENYVVLTTKYTYDKNGNLKTVVTPDQITTTYSYDKLNRQKSISKPNYNENGVLVSDISVSSLLNWEGKVVEATDAKLNKTYYDYGKRGFLEKIRKPVTVDGVLTEYTNAYYYDRAGRKIAEVSAKNYSPALTLNQMNRTEYNYDLMDRLKLKKYVFEEISYDPINLQEVRNWISIITEANKYDDRGNIVKKLDATGYESSTGSTPEEKIDSGYGTEYTYNFLNKVITLLDPVSKERGLGYSERNEYDALGNKISTTSAKGYGTDSYYSFTKYQYDNAGNIIQTSVKKNINDITCLEQVIMSSTYDLLGNPLVQYDGNNNPVRYEYNDFNKVRKIIYPADSSIIDGQVTYQYDTLGNLKYESGSEGNVKLYTYDNEGRLLSTTVQKQDGSESVTTSTMYDINGNKKKEVDGNENIKENLFDELNRLIATSDTVTNVNGVAITKTTQFKYDPNNNKVLEKDWRGNEYVDVYDPINRLVEKRDPYTSLQKIEYNHNSAQVKSYDALGNLTRYEYDKNGRQVSTLDPELHNESQDYDNAGNIRIITDGRTYSTIYKYDEFNKLAEVKNAKNETTSFTYDLNGNMLTQKDGRGNTTTYEYNVRNLVTRKVDQGGITLINNIPAYDLSKTEQYTYYPDGNLNTKTDRNGKTTVYTYYAEGWLKSKTIDDKTISYKYDGNGNQLEISDETGITKREYDEENRVIKKTVPEIGLSTFLLDITEGIDFGCWAETTTDPKQNVTTKVYDKAGRLWKVTSDGKTSTYTYYNNGSRQSIEYTGGTREDYTYYKDGLLWTLKNYKKTNGAETLIDSYVYEYDAAHNQTSKDECINNVSKGVTTYSYDCLNRLENITEPNSTKTTIYTYDAAGNRETETVISGTTKKKTTYSNNEQNRLNSTVTTYNDGSEKTVRFTYDNNGNMIYKGCEVTKPVGETEVETLEAFVDGEGDSDNDENVSLFYYDDWNQLVKTTTSSKTCYYTYNGEGLRVSKNINGQITKYLYDYDKVVLELDDAGAQLARNIYGINLLMRNVEGDTLFYLYNGHADVTALIDTSGAIVASYYYDAFGNILESTGDINNSIRYAGYQYDEETGLYYLSSRMYDAKIARFLQEDTYGGDLNDPLSLNRYTYVQNNPIIYYDPTGHFFDVIFDIGSIVYDGYQIYKDPYEWTNWASLGLDVVGAAIPFCTGLGEGFRLLNYGYDSFNYVYDALNYGYDSFNYGYHALNYGYDSFNYGYDALNYGYDALNYGYDAFNYGYDAFNYGYDAFNYGYDAFNYGYDALNYGYDALNYGYDAFNYGYDAFNYGYDTFNYGYDAFNYGYDTFNYGYDAFNYGYDTFNYATDAFNNGYDAFNYVTDTFNYGYDTYREFDNSYDIIGDIGKYSDDQLGIQYEFATQMRLPDVSTGVSEVETIANEAKSFDVVKYGDRATGFENHHGVLDVWAKHNIPGYVSRDPASTSMRLTAGTAGEHAATKEIYRDWLFEKTGKKVGGKVDWTTVSPQEIQSLSEKMMDAAKVPEAARRSYYQEFHKYIYNLK